MKNILHKKDAKSAGETYSWFCGSCNSYHVKTGETLLTFTPAEYSEFVQSVVETFSIQGIAAGFRQLRENRV